jgi:hypothetical protein
LDTESGRQQQLKPTTDEKEFNEIPVSDRLPDWRGHGQLGAVSAHYYYRMERERKHPREYLSVYKNLIEEPPDGFQFDLYDFVWVVAMSDLFIPEDSLLLGEFETNGREEIDRNINDYMAVSNYIQKVHLPGEDANPTTFQSYDIKACMEETGEEHIYPLWFKTFQEGNEIRFDTNVDRELVGSRMLLQRLAGQRKLQNLGANEEYVDDFVDSMREDLKDSEPDLEQED